MIINKIKQKNIYKNNEIIYNTLCMNIGSDVTDKSEFGPHLLTKCQSVRSLWTCRPWTLCMKTLSSVMEPLGQPRGSCFCMKTLYRGQHTNRPICMALPQRLNVSNREVRPSFNECILHHIQVTCWRGDRLWWLAKWADKWGNDEKWGAVSWLVSGSIGPLLPCCVRGCLCRCPNQASQRWHTAYCTEALARPTVH